MSLLSLSASELTNGASRAVPIATMARATTSRSPSSDSGSATGRGTPVRRSRRASRDSERAARAHRLRGRPYRRSGADLLVVRLDEVHGLVQAPFGGQLGSGDEDCPAGNPAGPDIDKCPRYSGCLRGRSSSSRRRRRRRPARCARKPGDPTRRGGDRRRTLCRLSTSSRRSVVRAAEAVILPLRACGPYPLRDEIELERQP